MAKRKPGRVKGEKQPRTWQSVTCQIPLDLLDEIDQEADRRETSRNTVIVERITNGTRS